MLRGLAGKVAVLAGGAGGIGSAVSNRLAAEGATVVVGDRNGDAARQVADQIGAAGGLARGVEVDIADEESVSRLFAVAVEAYGRVDLLHANAADLSPEVHLQDVDAVEAPIEVFDQIIRVNLRGYVLCTRAAVPLMLETGRGDIVYTSSLGAFIGGRNGFYSTSKSGVNSLMRHIAAIYGKRGIRANAVAPGLILTPAARALEDASFIEQHLKIVPMTRVGQPDDIASIVAMLLSEESDYLQGQTINVNGGLYMT